MDFPEEGLAQALHQALQQKFAGSETQAWVRGSGAHCHCLVRRAHRDCVIHCFVAGPRDGGQGEYLAFLEDGGHRVAEGRTRDAAAAVDLAADWASRLELRNIHSKYDFIDRQRRALTKLHREILELEPSLAMRVDGDILPGVAEHCELDFLAGDRSCLVSFYGYEELPRFYFQWDECVLLTTQCGDVARDARMLRRWLVDKAKPSAMATEFPDLQLKPEARFYEEGRGIEGEFIVSWDHIEDFYRELKFSDTAQVLALISAMRRAGFDRQLRAGQSLYTLILSRSRRHGLRGEQPNLRFEFVSDGMKLTPRFDGLGTLKVPKIALTPEVNVLLNQLAEKPID